MEPSADRDWASEQLLDPLTDPQPVDETGPGTHFRSTYAPGQTPKSAAPNPDEKKRASFSIPRKSVNAYPSPPDSASATKTTFLNYTAASSARKSIARDSISRPSSEIPTSTVRSSINGDSSTLVGSTRHRRRGSSLGSRFPGDKSHRPLDMLRQDTKKAQRSPHLRKSQQVGTDTIDRLDTVGVAAYHHDGPYDATLLARNLNHKYSPVAATRGTNLEALKATPSEAIRDSVRGHRPLSDVAAVPSGMPDRYGRTYSYEEGPNLNVEMGYRRWEGITYHPDDIKGKGEPSYTIEKALKDHKHRTHRRVFSDGGIELTERRRAHSNPFAPPRSSNLKSGSTTGADVLVAEHAENAGEVDLSQTQRPYSEWSGEMRRANTTGRKSSGSGNVVSRRFESLRRRSAQQED